MEPGNAESSHLAAPLLLAAWDEAMPVEVECAACFNRGSGQGWVARTTDGVVHWLCPGCVASDSQPIPIVTAADLARLTNSQAQRAISVCPKCGAAGPAGKCPLCQLQREARLRTGKRIAIALAVVAAILLIGGVTIWLASAR
jgi:hypothetical protein